MGRDERKGVGREQVVGAEGKGRGYEGEVRTAQSSVRKGTTGGREGRSKLVQTHGVRALEREK